MRTIRENLEEAIGLLKTNLVMNHLKACELVYMDLSTLPNFPPDVLGVFLYYQKYLVEKHQSIQKVGFFEKIFQWFHSRFTRKKLEDFLNKAQRLELGDGSKYLQEIFLLVRKAI
jgi:hypothetical protein